MDQELNAGHSALYAGFGTPVSLPVISAMLVPNWVTSWELAKQFVVAN